MISYPFSFRLFISFTMICLLTPKVSESVFPETGESEIFNISIICSCLFKADIVSPHFFFNCFVKYTT